MAYFAVPVPLRANIDDVPLVMVNTAPELEQSAFNMSSSTIDADSLVIEATIGVNGRVDDYRILSEPKGAKKLLPEVKQMLIFTTFRPALSMGHPTSGGRCCRSRLRMRRRAGKEEATESHGIGSREAREASRISSPPLRKSACPA